MSKSQIDRNTVFELKMSAGSSDSHSTFVKFASRKSSKVLCCFDFDNIESMYGITVQDPDSGPRVSVMSTSRDKDQAEFISHMVQYLLDTKQVHHSI